MSVHREMVKFRDRVRTERVGLPALKMRIGIHTGPVVVGTLGNDLRVEFKAVGDTVNLASRMEELAEPGTTYVTEETFKLTEGLFRHEALGGKEIRGKEEPVNVYQVIAPSTRRTRFDVSAERGLTPFVGRDRELEILLDGFQEVKEGRGQAFSIVAEAGVGKSRLLYEFRKAVANENVTFLEGKSLSYSRGVVYHPVIDMLKSNFDVQEDDGSSQITERVKEGLRLVGADEPSTLSHLLELLSVEENGIEKVQLSPETRKERIIESLKTIVLRGSEIRPLIMAFEDLHWVDKSSEDAFRALLESIPGARVLLIFTYRPEFVHTWGGKSYHSQLNLNRLSNREALGMVSHLLGTKDIEKALAELILQKTEGIPFYIEEFVKSLREQAIIERKNNRYHMARDIQEVAIPGTIQDVIMARVDSLPEGAKDVLQTASAIDREFSCELIKRVSGLREQELIGRMSTLKDSELLYERGIYPQVTYVFKHALTQEVAYNGLLFKRRSEIHEKIGRAIEELYPERLEEYYQLLAYHYVRSDNKDKAVEYLDLANQKVAKASAMEEAKDYFDQAMKLLDTVLETEEGRERQISLLVNQSFVFGLLLRLPEYYELLAHYEPLLALVGNPGLEGAFYARLGQCEFAFGSLDRAIQTLAKAAELCEAAGNAADAGIAYYFLQFSHFTRGDFEQAVAVKEKVLRKTDEQFNLLVCVRALAGGSLACATLGRLDEAIEAGRNALSLAREFSDNSQIAFAAFAISLVYTTKGDLDRAKEYAELAAKKAATPLDEVLTQAGLAYIWSRTGEPHKGIEKLASLVQIVRAGRMVQPQLLGGAWLGEAYLLARRYDEARQTTKELVELAQRCGAKHHLGLAHRLLGEIALKKDPDQAVPHFEKAISIFREIKAESQAALAYSGMGRYHKQQGDTEQARRYLAKALEIFERLGTLIEPDKVRAELAELPQGDVGRRERQT
jgi:predicted ATPase